MDNYESLKIFDSAFKNIDMQSLKNILDAFRECIFLTTTDDENRFIYINKAGIKLLENYKNDIKMVYGYDIDIDSLIGTSIHKFHKNPDNVRALLKSLKPGEVLKNADIIVGNMVIESYRMGIFDEDGNPIYYMGIWQDITDKINLAKNLRIQSRLKRFSKFLGDIINISSYTKDENEFLQEVCNAAIKNTYIKLAWIGKPDEIGRFEIVASAGETSYLKNAFISIDPNIEESKNPTTKAYLEQKSQYFMTGDDISTLWQERNKKYGFSLIISLPIFKNNKIWGVFTLHKGITEPVDDELKELLEDISKYISYGLDKIELTRQKEEVENFNKLLLNNLTTGILVVRYPDRIIEYANDKAAKLLGASSEEELIEKSTKIASIDDKHFLEFDKLIKEVIEKGFTIKRNIPYKRADGSIRHVDISGQKLPSKTEYEDRIIWIFVDVEDRYKLESDLYKQATTDLLTDIPNRRFFDSKLEETLHSVKLNNRKLFVCVIDLDDFKQINDEYGTDVADEVLKIIANRLKNTIRDIDLVARLTDDEFGIVIYGIKDDEVNTILEKIENAIRTPINISSYTINLNGSIGAVVYDSSKENLNEVDLIRMAYRPLYDLKMHKKDRLHSWTVYNEGVRLKQTRSQELLYKRYVEVFYQPILDIKQNKIVGVEALARLKDEEGKIISPAVFLNELNKKDIEELTYIVLEKAITDLKAIEKDLGIELWVSVNIDPSNLSEAFIQNIKQKIINTNIDPYRLSLEILETSESEQKDKLADYIMALKTIGVSIALDDVGSAYSSLLRIKELPIDKIKLDQSFIRTLNKRPKDLTFVQSINSLADGLNVDLVVEGVETEDILDSLLIIGVPMMQGYHIAKPMPLEALKDFIKDKFNFLKDYDYPKSLLGAYTQSLLYHNHIKRLLESNIFLIDVDTLSDYMSCPSHKSLCKLISCNDKHIKEFHSRYHDELGQAVKRFLESKEPVDWDYLQKLHEDFTNKLLNLIK